MRDGWEIKKLGEVCDFQGGSQPPKEEWISEPREGYVRMLQIRDFTQSRSFDIEYVKVSNRLKYCAEEDVLLGRYGASVGKVLTGLAGAYNVAIMKTIPDETLLTKKFFKYFLMSPDFQAFLLQASTMRAAQAGFSREDIQDYPFNLPPLSEQERIVAELDCLSSIIEKQKQQLKEYDTLAQSIFYDMFGDPDDSLYPRQSLKALAESNLSYGSGASAIEYDGEIRYIRITDIMEDGKLDNNAMSPNVFDDRYLLNDGDILFARSGATVGKTYHYKESDGKAIYAGYLIRFIPNRELVMPEYIYYYTRSPYYQAFIKKNAQAVAQPNINAKQYGDLQVCVPPLDLQQQFASKVEAIEKQKAILKKNIEETELLFNSRMDYYFN